MRIVLLFFVLFNILFSSDNSIEKLLNEIEKKEDLSLKTKEESAGISYVITRYQLDMMQARYLRDILKNTSIAYEISRYGVLDPWTSNNLPYSSSGIRVFIDNQEIASARYGNGLFMLGNVNLSFVDHIEIYYLNPSYKITTEPAYVIIKLYTKQPKRDEGTAVLLSYGTYGSNSQSFETAYKNSYLNFSRSEINHKKTDIEGTVISRDNSNYHFLWTYKHNNTNYLLNAIYQKQDPFMGMSLDGRLQDGYEKYNEIHFGIEHKYSSYDLKYTLDYLKDDVYFFEDSGLYIKDDLLVKKVTTKGYGVVNGLKLNSEKILEKNSIFYGAGFRNKRMNYNKINVNDEDIDYKGIKNQNIANLFIEDNIQLKKNWIFTLGYEFSRYFNDITNDYNLHNYKIVSTFLYNRRNIFKLSLNHIEYSVPPYFYNTLFTSECLKPQKNDLIIAKYKKLLDSENDIQIVGLYGINKNYIIVGDDGSLTSYDKKIFFKMLDFKYHKNYNMINDFVFNYIYINFENIALNRSHKIILLNTHRYKKFEFFENIVYKNNKYSVNGNKYKKDGIDLSLGIKYNYNENLIFSLKGENLLNDTYKNSFTRTSIHNQNDIQTTDVQLIDKKISVGMEYLF